MRNGGSAPHALPALDGTPKASPGYLDMKEGISPARVLGAARSIRLRIQRPAAQVAGSPRGSARSAAIWGERTGKAEPACQQRQHEQVDPDRRARKRVKQDRQFPDRPAAPAVPQWLVPSSKVILFQTLYFPEGLRIGGRFTSSSVFAS